MSPNAQANGCGAGDNRADQRGRRRSSRHQSPQAQSTPREPEFDSDNILITYLRVIRLSIAFRPPIKRLGTRPTPGDRPGTSRSSVCVANGNADTPAGGAGMRQDRGVTDVLLWISTMSLSGGRSPACVGTLANRGMTPRRFGFEAECNHLLASVCPLGSAAIAPVGHGAGRVLGGPVEEVAISGACAHSRPQGPPGSGWRGPGPDILRTGPRPRGTSPGGGNGFAPPESSRSLRCSFGAGNSGAARQQPPDGCRVGR